MANLSASIKMVSNESVARGKKSDVRWDWVGSLEASMSKHLAQNATATADTRPNLCNKLLPNAHGLNQAVTTNLVGMVPSTIIVVSKPYLFSKYNHNASGGTVRQPCKYTSTQYKYNII